MQYAKTLDQLMAEVEILENEIETYRNGTEVR